MQSDHVPLTFQQLAFWHIFKLQTGSHRLDTFALRIAGPLNADLLGRCLEALVRRHEALRARVQLVDGRPMQRFDTDFRFRLDVIELDQPGNDAPQDRARKLVEQLAGKPCDLSTGPLFAVTLIRISEHEHVLAWGIHHIISDGSTNRMIFGELWSAYAAQIRGRGSPLTDHSLSYAEYAVRQHRNDSVWMQAHSPYWKRKIADAAPLAWPDARQVTESEGYAMGLVALELSADLCAHFREVAQLTHTTPAMVVLSAYALVLSQWCDRNDFVIPLNGSCRQPVQEDRLAGYFGQFLYLRAQLKGVETFIELTAKISREFYQALLHQDFGRVSAERLDLLSGAIFSWLPWSLDEIAGVPPPALADEMGIAVEQFAFTNKLNNSGDFKPRGIGLFVMEAGGAFRATLLYSRNVFDQSTVERFGRHFIQVSEDLTARPYRRVNEAARAPRSTARSVDRN